MKKVLWLIVCLMTMVVGANAQNSIVDELTGKKYDDLLLDPNKSIKENYAKIDSLMSLHKEKNFAKYTIMVWGHYTNKYNDYSCDSYIGRIQVKGEIDEYYQTISGRIIKALTKLYSHSLDTPFNVKDEEYSWRQVSVKKRITMGDNKLYYLSPSSPLYKKICNKVNKLYYLYPSSPLYKKIYNKVIEETGLKDGGRMSLNRRINN